MSDRPLISVITVVLNAERLLEETIASVLEQGYPNLDYVVIDGGSTDGTPEIVERFRKRIAAFVSEPDRGIYDAMNKGLGLARGELVGFLNAGDRYLPGALEQVANAARQWPAAGIFYGDTLVEQEDAEMMFLVPGTMNHRRGMGFHHPAMFARRRVCDAMGGFDLAFSLAADYDLVLRALRAGVSFHHIEATLDVYRNCGESYRNQRRTLQEIRRINRRHYGLASLEHAECLWSSAKSLGLLVLEPMIGFIAGERMLRKMKRAYVRRVLTKKQLPRRIN